VSSLAVVTLVLNLQGSLLTSDQPSLPASGIEVGHRAQSRYPQALFPTLNTQASPLRRRPGITKSKKELLNEALRKNPL